MKCRGEVNCGPYSANGICLDPSAEIGYVASEDCNIVVVNLNEFKIEYKLSGHEDSV